MHVHLPKPLHGWRAFVGEVGVIVLGVLIALGAEQIVESIHNRNIESQTRRDVRDEASIDLAFVLGRLGESSCVLNRIGQLSDFIERARMPMAAIWVGRPRNVPIFLERWKAVTSTARSSIFSPREQAQLDILYELYSDLKQDEAAEQQTWTDLKTLERLRGSINPQMRLFFLRAIESARHEDYEVRVRAYFAIRTARALALVPNRKYGPRGEISSVCLPVTTSPAAADRILSTFLPHAD